MTTPRFRNIIGVDPGPVPGIVVLSVWDNGEFDAHAIQCSHTIASTLVDGLVRNAGEEACLIAVERFVVGRGSMRSRKDGVITRDLVGQLQRVSNVLGTTYTERTAAAIKPWASEERLALAGLLEPTKGMRHARDAARHALFAAVRDGGLSDPLSCQRRRP